MKRTLLVTTATVALIAGMSIASAQMGGSGGGGDQPRMQNSPTGSGAAPKGEETVKPGIHEKEPGAAVQREQKEKGKLTQGQTGQGEKLGQGVQEKTRKEGQIEPRGGNREKVGQDQEREKTRIQGQGQTEQKERATTQTQQGSQGSGKSVQLSSEQRTKIHATLSRQKVERITNVNFSIRVGARIPRTVHLYALPVEIVEIVPEYRGYEYVLVGDEILIIDPNTLEIVAVLPA